MRLRAWVAVCGLVAALVAPPAMAWRQQPDEFEQKVAGLFGKLRAEACVDHLDAATEFASTPEFESAMLPIDRLAFLWQVAYCAYHNQKYEIALRHAERAVFIKQDDSAMQWLRLSLGSYFGRPQSSIEALTALADFDAKMVRDVKLQGVTQLLRAAREQDQTGETELAVHEALVKAAYRPEPPYFDDGLKMAHGRLLLDRGRIEDARKRLADMVGVTEVVAMRIDRRFDPLRKDAAFDAGLDVARALERELVRARATMIENPKLLAAVNEYVRTLQIAMRNDEALAIADETLARHVGDTGYYQDADQSFNWLLNERGYILYALGRFDEGRASLYAGAGRLEWGAPNVSNLINLSGYLVLEGRPKEALALLERVGKASPYGDAWIATTRSCAAVQLEDEALLGPALEYLKAHESDNPAALTHALLCAGDLDGAAALMIRRLGGLSTRVAALLAVQTTPETQTATLPFRAVLRERFDRMMSRDEVRAAVDAVGRVEKLPIDPRGLQ